MKIVFNLTDKQIINAKKLVSTNMADSMLALKQDQFFTVDDPDGGSFMCKINNTGKKFVNVDPLIGFLEFDGKNVPVISSFVNMRKLVITGTRNIITSKEVVLAISKVLGNCWRVAEPEVVEGDEITDKLFWWESYEHFLQYRSEWDKYFQWLKNNIDQDLGIAAFDSRFTNENRCLNMLRNGKIAEAKNIFGDQLIEDILTMA